MFSLSALVMVVYESERDTQKLPSSSAGSRARVELVSYVNWSKTGKRWKDWQRGEKVA